MKPGDLVLYLGKHNYIGIFLKRLTPSHTKFQKDINMGEFLILGKIKYLSIQNFEVIMAEA